MTFSRFVEIGRVVCFTYGRHAGKIATILEVIDHNRVIVDGPVSRTGVERQVVSLRWVQLTDLVVPVPRNAGAAALEKALDASGVLAKWENSNWAKTIAKRNMKASLNDFQRFALAKAKKHRVAAIAPKLRQMKKTQRA